MLFKLIIGEKMKLRYIILISLLLVETLYSADFYSITSGNWNSPGSWSNVSHTGPAAIDYPRTENDRVIIGSGHSINFLSPAIIVGSVEIINGSLNISFGLNKLLLVKNDIIVRENGSLKRMLGTSALGYDTLEVHGNFENYSSGKNIVSLHGDQNNIVMLKFAGDRSGIISGDGNWSVSDVEINKKAGKQDTVVNMSASFTTALSERITAYSGFLNIISGVYHHNNSSSIYLTSDDSDDYTVHSNGGINISRGEVWTRVGMLLDDNSSLNISGGILIIGISAGHHLLYGINSVLKNTGGEIMVAGVFANSKPNSSVRFEMTGGRMYVLKHGEGFSNIQPAFYLTAGSVLTWNFDDNTNMDMSRIVITRQHTNNALSYSVQTNNYQVTGGNLQFGEEGTNLSAKYQPFTINSLAPVWNLDIAHTKVSDSLFSSVLQISTQLQVLNDMIISAGSAYDLNCNTLSIQGDFKNMGRFTPDGAGNNTTGEKKVIFSGSEIQSFSVVNPIQNSQSPNSVNNEPFINVEINKPDGSIVLGSDASSNFVVRNSLVFTSINNASLDSRSNDKYVEINPRDANDLGVITRTGKGHIDGKLRMPATISSTGITFPVGAGGDYTPARVDFSGTGGTSGKIEIIAYPQDPSNLSGNGLNIDLDKNIKRYWTLQPVDNFSLGTRNYSVALQFLNPKDIRNGADWNKFRQFNATQEPYIMLPAGQKSNILNQSTGNTVFGDFVIAEEPVNAVIVKGRVTDKNSLSPISGAFVTFTNLSSAKETSVVTDGDGQYEITLDEGANYYAKAELAKQYITQYYNDTQSFAEAEPVDPAAGSTVDFQLKQIPAHSNLVAGKVVDKTNFGVPAWVIGYLKNSDDYTETAKYEPRTIEALTDEGNFQFEGLAPGKYIFMAIPVSTGLVPGYYFKNDFSVASWLQSTEIVVEETTKSYANVIKLRDITAATGKGKVSGIIIGEELKLILKEDDNPMAKKQVSGAMTFTVDENDKVRKYDFSEKGGGYTMSDLPNGNYKVGADKVGYNFYEEGFSVSNADSDIKKDIELIPYEENSVWEHSTLMPVQVYPNPAREFVCINMKDVAVLQADVQILDLQGRVCESYKVNESKPGIVKISTIGLMPGFYVFQLINLNRIYSACLVIY